MTKIDDKTRKMIEKKVDTYIKKNEIKDETGTVISNPVLVVAPESILNFFRSGVCAGLNKEETFHAKHYYKSKLPFAEYRRTRGKDKELRIADILHFRELQEGGSI